jgi:diaminopimelate decarboxylase
VTAVLAPATPSPWPASTHAVPGGDLAVGGVRLADVAARFSTPTYVVDEAEFRGRCRTYRAAFPDAEVRYAAKSFLCLGIASWLADEGLGVDVCSAGELRTAVAAGIDPGSVVLHGNAKSPEDLATALALGVRHVVLDSRGEVPLLAALVPVGHRQQVMLRVVPDIAAGAHAKVRTGVLGQKFGIPLGRELAAAVDAVLAQPRLELVGLHCHLGSQITDIAPYLTAIRLLVAELAAIRDRHGLALPLLDVGGGHGIAHRPGDPALDVDALGGALAWTLADCCGQHGLPLPRLVVEPGRAIAGPSAVALYRVLSVKRAGRRRLVAVDGGMSDNPRPALYGSAYTARLVGRRSYASACPTAVVGRHCEAGDVLVEDVQLPGDVRAGDLLAVPASGAYQLSMASTYNQVGRPPVVAVRDGKARLLVRRENWADITARDVGV